MEAFLGSKSFPWWKTSDTVARADDLEALSDYLYSGGQFTDIEQPILYLKHVLCKDILISFRATLNARINQDKSDPIVKLLIETLKDMILSHIPRWAHLIQMIDRAITVGRMGKGGPNLDSFTDQLILDIEQCPWSTMTVTEATVLYWLNDLYASDRDQEELGKLIHRHWDEAEKQGVPFTGRVSDKTN